MPEMIPFIARMGLMAALLALLPTAALNAAPASATPRAAASATPVSTAPATTPTAACLPSGDGYFRAELGGAIDSKIDWPNSGTRCQGEARNDPPGVRLSFQRSGATQPDLLFVFGLSGVRAGQAAHALGTNLTLIVQGTPRIYGTLGDSRCTVDSLAQTPLETPGAYRLEARGFCTQPAHAVRGSGAVLVKTFEFAGLVNFQPDNGALALPAQSVRR